MSNERSPRAVCSTTMGTSGIRLSFRQRVGCRQTIATRRLSTRGSADEPATRGGDRGDARGGLGVAGRRGGPRALARARPRAQDPRRGRRRALPAGVVVVARGRTRDARRVLDRRGARCHAGGRHRNGPRLPARPAGLGVRPGGRLTDEVGAVFSALADPTRRWMVETLLREESTTVPALTSALPISRQAVAKHLAILDDAGLV